MSSNKIHVQHQCVPFLRRWTYEVICALSHGLVRQATRLLFTCQPAQTGTNLATSEIIDHVRNVPGNCCLIIYGLHNGSQYRGQTCNVDCSDDDYCDGK